MKRKKQFRLLTAWLLLAAILTACAGKGGQTPAAATAQTTAAPAETTAAPETVPAETTQEAATAAQTEAAETTAAETEAEEATAAETEAAVDRYEEIIDRSGDDGKFVVYFLDLEVGPDATDKSGDSTILISPDGKVMLLDAGHPDAADMVIQVLEDLGIETIDYLVASHPHIDHIGGIPAVVEKFPVGMAYRSYVDYTTQTFNNYINALEKAGIPVTQVKTGDVIDFGEQMQIEILGPEEEIEYPEGFPQSSTQFLNDHSVLMKFHFGETTALFGGDLYTSQEREYVELYGEELAVDLAKANHHGKDTSNSNKWIRTVHPRIVAAMGDEMVSMDAYNRYLKEGGEYHFTLVDGIIKVILDDQGNYEVIDQFDSWMN